MNKKVAPSDSYRLLFFIVGLAAVLTDLVMEGMPIPEPGPEPEPEPEPYHWRPGSVARSASQKVHRHPNLLTDEEARLLVEETRSALMVVGRIAWGTVEGLLSSSTRPPGLN